MLNDTDQQFFKTYPDRRAHIRKPLDRVLVKNPQRAVFFAPECEQEFLSLGAHDESRRRIILYRLPAENKHYNKNQPQIFKIPFLTYSDETIVDEDSVLLPIVDELMRDAARSMA